MYFTYKHIRSLVVSAFILCVVFLIACGTKGTLTLYEGPRKTPDEVADITTASKGSVIVGVDSLIKKKPFYIKEKFIEVLPGLHTIHVAYSRIKGDRRKTSNSPLILELNAKAGHHYGVKTESGLRRWQAWIVDLADNRVVVDKQEGFLQ